LDARLGPGDLLNGLKIVNTEGIEIVKIFLTESQIYQVGISEILCIISFHHARRSEKTVLRAITSCESTGYLLPPPLGTFLLSGLSEEATTE